MIKVNQDRIVSYQRLINNKGPMLLQVVQRLEGIATTRLEAERAAAAAQAAESAAAAVPRQQQRGGSGEGRAGGDA